MSDTLFLATRKGLFTVARQGDGAASWTVARSDFVGDNLSIAMQDKRDGALLAALDLGHFGVKLHRANGPGEPWEECQTPAYPEKPEEEVSVDMWGRPLPWTTAKIWALEEGGPDEPGVIWCGTLPGGLFRSANGGRTWTFMRSLWDDPKRKEWMGGGADLPGVHSVCVDPRNSKEVRLGVSTGGVWITRDGGGTWTSYGAGLRALYVPPEKTHDPNVQDVHRIVQSPSSPDHLWIQHHNGIFRSIDGGANWTEIEKAGPSTFGFAVAVHPKDAKTAWFIPMLSDEKRIPPDGRLVVTRTRDGGESFDVLTEGLPKGNVYDLVYRHCLDIDGTGERLAFGTTGGALYVSENGGDAWTCAAQHLSPIYSVRFGK